MRELTPLEYNVLQIIRGLSGWYTGHDIHLAVGGNPSTKIDTVSALKHLADFEYIQRVRASNGLTLYARKGEK